MQKVPWGPPCGDAHMTQQPRNVIPPQRTIHEKGIASHVRTFAQWSCRVGGRPLTRGPRQKKAESCASETWHQRACQLRALPRVHVAREGHCGLWTRLFPGRWCDAHTRQPRGNASAWTSGSRPACTSRMRCGIMPPPTKKVVRNVSTKTARHQIQGVEMRINECDGKAAIVHLVFCSQVLTFADKCNATWRLISWHHQACVACCPERLLAEFGGNQPAHDDMHPRTANDGPHDLMHEATRAAHSPVHLSRLDGRQLQQLNRLVLHITARSGRTTNTARKERRTPPTPTRRGLFRGPRFYLRTMWPFQIHFTDLARL